MDWFQAVERIGLAGVTVLFVGFAAAWLGRRFIGKGGLLTKLGERHVQFIDKTESLMQDSLHLQTKAIEMAAETTVDQHRALASTLKIRKAGLRACDIVEKVASEMNLDVTTELTQVRKELNGGERLG